MDTYMKSYSDSSSIIVAIIHDLYYIFVIILHFYYVYCACSNLIDMISSYLLHRCYFSSCAPLYLLFMCLILTSAIIIAKWLFLEQLE